MVTRPMSIFWLKLRVKIGNNILSETVRLSKRFVKKKRFVTKIFLAYWIADFAPSPYSTDKNYNNNFLLNCIYGNILFVL